MAYLDIVIPGEYAIIGSISPDDLIRAAVRAESDEKSLPATSFSSLSEEKETSFSTFSGDDDDDDKESSKESSEESSEESSAKEPKGGKKKQRAPTPKPKVTGVLENTIPLAVSVPTAVTTQKTVSYYNMGPLEANVKVFAQRIVASNLDNQMDVVTSILWMEVAHQRLCALKMEK